MNEMEEMKRDHNFWLGVASGAFTAVMVILLMVLYVSTH